MKKNLFFLLLSLFSCLNILAADTRLGILKGMCSVPFANMLDLPGYEAEIYESEEKLISDMRDGNIDATVIGALAAEKLTSAAPETFVAKAVVSTSDFRIVGKSKDINFSNLPGNVIGVGGNGMGSLMLRYMLKKNGIPVESREAGVELVTYATEAEAVNAYLTYKVNYVLVSEPAEFFLVRKSTHSYDSIDLQKKLKEIGLKENAVPLTVFVMNSNFAAEGSGRPEQLCADLENSIQDAILKPELTSAIIVKNKLGIPGHICAGAIKKSNLCYRTVSGNLHLIVNQ